MQPARRDRCEVRIRRGPLALLVSCTLLLALDGPRGKTQPSPQFDALPTVGAAQVARVLARANPSLSPRQLDRIGNAVVRYSEKYGLEPELVTAIILVESSARPEARSPKGAMGLMQVMPYMHALLGPVGNTSTLETNIEAGCLILASNIRRLGEDDGISAYFWGSNIRGVGYLERVRAARAAVRRWIRS